MNAKDVFFTFFECPLSRQKGVSMLINEVSKMTGLTKKAIEYYTVQGLVSPSVLENGYRDYSQENVEQLIKISVLRKLGIGTEDIRKVLSDQTRSALQKLSVQKELDVQREHWKNTVLNQLGKGKSYSEVNEELIAIEQNKTITEKLLEAFPGYYGRFVCMHFARFLMEPIKNDEQQVAFDTIISFLDNMPTLILPDELQELLRESTDHIGTEDISHMLEKTKTSIENPEEFMSNNKEFIEQYMAFLQSEEYKNSPLYKLKMLMKQFNSTSGYNDVFIPALKKLSSSYEEYYKQIESANEILIANYPDINSIDDFI